jgi:GTPase
VTAVLDGLAETGTLEADWRARAVEVLNRADLLGGVAALSGGAGDGVAVSATTGEGLADLLDALDARLGGGGALETAGYGIAASDGARLAWLYEHGEVVGREDGEDGVVNLTVRLRPADRGHFERGLPPRAAARAAIHPRTRRAGMRDDEKPRG